MSSDLYKLNLAFFPVFGSQNYMYMVLLTYQSQRQMDQQMDSSSAVCIAVLC